MLLTQEKQTIIDLAHVFSASNKQGMAEMQKNKNLQRELSEAARKEEILQRHLKLSQDTLELTRTERNKHRDIAEAINEDYCRSYKNLGNLHSEMKAKKIPKKWCKRVMKLLQEMEENLNGINKLKQQEI